MNIALTEQVVDSDGRGLTQKLLEHGIMKNQIV
jgi:hypothetical protein